LTAVPAIRAALLARAMHFDPAPAAPASCETEKCATRMASSEIKFSLEASRKVSGFDVNSFAACIYLLLLTRSIFPIFLFVSRRAESRVASLRPVPVAVIIAEAQSSCDLLRFCDNVTWRFPVNNVNIYGVMKIVEINANELPHEQKTAKVYRSIVFFSASSMILCHVPVIDKSKLYISRSLSVARPWELERQVFKRSMMYLTAQTHGFTHVTHARIFTWNSKLRCIYFYAYCWAYCYSRI